MINSKDVSNKFNKVFIVTDRNEYHSISDIYSKKDDLVLSFDFALIKSITDDGGNAQFLDCFFENKCKLETYQKPLYQFLAHWFQDKNNNATVYSKH